MIYISHKFDEIFRIADRVTVLRDGEYIGTRPHRRGRPAEFDPHDGRAQLERSVPRRRSRRSGDVALRVDRLGLRRTVGKAGRALHDLLRRPRWRDRGHRRA